MLLIQTNNSISRSVLLVHCNTDQYIPSQNMLQFQVYITVHYVKCKTYYRTEAGGKGKLPDFYMLSETDVF